MVPQRRHLEQRGGGHVRLPDVSDAYLVDNQLYLSPPTSFAASRPIGFRYAPATGPYDQSR